MKKKLTAEELDRLYDHYEKYGTDIDYFLEEEDFDVDNAIEAWDCHYQQLVDDDLRKQEFDYKYGEAYDF